MGYNQYTVPDTIAVEPILLLLSFSIRNHMSTVSCAILSNFFEEQLVNSKPPTNYTFRDCGMHFFRQPFLKYLYIVGKPHKRGLLK